MSLDTDLLSRVEDAGLNASAPPQQRWMDGWLLRYNPGKARRARCINAVAAGRLPLDDKLHRAQALYGEHGLPLVLRITPFSQPADLDSTLAARGWDRIDATQVLVCPRLPAAPSAALASNLQCIPLDADAYAATVGQLRGSPLSQQQAHAERLRHSPVPYRGYALQRVGGDVLACGQLAREGDLVGLYDVYTRSDARGQGHSRWLCEHMLLLAANEGATIGYLQVEADNRPAQAVYRRLGFVWGYDYHYRQPPVAV